MSCALDTNILVCTIAPASDPRRQRARELIIRGMRAGTTILRLQSLAEFSDVAIRKFGVSIAVVHRRIDAWCKALTVQAAVERDIVAALATVRDHKLRFWDALLCATAARSGVQYLLTEDLQDGRLVNGVTIVNPFDGANKSLVDQVLPP